MIVLDASVAVKWFFPEPLSDLAISSLVTHAGELVAPDIFAIEVNAALVRHSNIEKGKRADVALLLDEFACRLANSDIQLHRTSSNDQRSAAALAMAVGHPIKDCIYLVLAQSLDCELLTADTRFAAKARDIWTKVRVLGE